MKKFYGNTNTGLHLSAKAEALYSNSDYRIEEVTIDDVTTYTLTINGELVRSGMTAEAVNAYLEEEAEMEDTF